MGNESTDGTQTAGGCGYSSRRRRRRQRRDDLLLHLGLTGQDPMGLWGGYGDGETGQPAGRAVARIEELEKTVETMSETITALAERVKVLERIVVDDEANIAREIDKLKDSGAAK